MLTAGSNRRRALQLYRLRELPHAFAHDGHIGHGLRSLPVRANLFSDLALHHMGRKLADGITQGNAGPDQFRTYPLWGLGQRVFFLHDGRTSNLADAIREHQSQGSEADQVIKNYENLSRQQKKNLILFLRSL
jgi:CxxC motif-containing protein (DUF1111 family)